MRVIDPLENHPILNSLGYESLKQDLKEYSPYLVEQKFFYNLVICGYHFENLNNYPEPSFINKMPEYSLGNDELTNYYTQLYNLEH